MQINWQRVGAGVCFGVCLMVAAVASFAACPDGFTQLKAGEVHGVPDGNVLAYHQFTRDDGQCTGNLVESGRGSVLGPWSWTAEAFCSNGAESVNDPAGFACVREVALFGSAVPGDGVSTGGTVSLVVPSITTQEANEAWFWGFSMVIGCYLAAWGCGRILEFIERDR